jgi:hypothetical protein
MNASFDSAATAQVLVISLAVCCFMFNSYVLIISRQSAIKSTLLGGQRVFTRMSFRVFWWSVLMENVFGLAAALILVIRIPYTVPVLTSASPWVVEHSTALLYTVLFLMTLAPGVALNIVAGALYSVDDETKAKVRRQLQVHSNAFGHKDRRR